MCCCFRGRSLNFTTNLYVNFISLHIPALHTLFSFIPTDHEITHQWSGNPHSWDSIYQHQRKPQRLLVKLLTNKFNTKGCRVWRRSRGFHGVTEALYECLLYHPSFTIQEISTAHTDVRLRGHGCTLCV